MRLNTPTPSTPETRMAWDYDQYADYIKKHAPASERSSLLKADAKPFVPKGDKAGKPAKIFATYYSMPDWLDIFNFRTRLEKTPFEHMMKDYRHQVQKHQDKVIECLDRINGFASGKALLEEVSSTAHWVRIMPYFHFFRTMPGLDYDNATARPLKPGETLSHVSDGTMLNLEDEYEKGAVVRGDDNEPLTERGTGKGANIALFFSPETWEDKKLNKGPGFRPDEVLYHELVHVSRQMRGKMTHVAVGGKGFPNIEEYFATVLTNVYLSDKSETRLRGYYSSDFLRQEHRHWKVNGQDVGLIIDPLPRDWNVMKDPDKFYDNPDKLDISPRQLMQIFRDKQPSFYLALAHLPKEWPPFNPVGRHFRENNVPAKKAKPAAARPW
jgi:hypothetical protein